MRETYLLLSSGLIPPYFPLIKMIDLECCKTGSSLFEPTVLAHGRVMSQVT